MRKIVTTIILIASVFTAFAQNMESEELEQRIAIIEAKMAIKNVLDEFSNLADTKEIDKQVLLFTEDGTVESYSNGERSSLLEGREQLEQAFSRFLSNFHTVYHQNGQQTIDLRGSEATATSYCRVILVGENDGNQVKTTLYTIYTDEFINQNGKWVIKHRKSNFVWREVE
ncbi:MAG: nuclear transport factor 2 family protein [Tissierellia bacterium]|nr:nuclear transport factor 2 family protein [Fermentimonas sp.]MDD4440157.1 nuclear transport factor 2 family protein [Tissierellia bacterium]